MASVELRGLTKRFGSLAVVDPQADIIDHDKRAEALGQAVQFNRRHALPPVDGR